MDETDRRTKLMRVSRVEPSRRSFIPRAGTDAQFAAMIAAKMWTSEPAGGVQ
jgi:hypothetical protein